MKRAIGILFCLFLAVSSPAGAETVSGAVSVHLRPADAKGPEIEIFQPEVTRGVAIRATEEVLTVLGHASDASGVASVLVNGQRAALDGQGRFSADVLLEMGENRIAVVATDIHRNETAERFSVRREAMKEAKEATAPPKPTPGTTAPAGAKGRSFALLVGINAYRNDVPALRTAAGDAKAVAQVLQGEYGFSAKLILDREATRDAILEQLEHFKRILNPEDRFLLYYAGHGWHDRETETSYWLPADSRKDSKVKWIMSKAVTDELKLIRARQVLVVADSCYSGTLERAFDPDVAARGGRESYLRRMQEKPSRVLIASGGNEPVSDSGGSGHSIFAAVLLRALRSPGRDAFTAQELFAEHIREAVAGRSEQTPEYKTIRASNHDGGDFVFIRKR
ncbi:MAG TPA: caspase family protein [Syntrophales bacterium]|nr:caspase family protein [Syntrophales bacterium]